MSNRETVVIGYSGHGWVLSEAAIRSGFRLLYYIDLKQAERNPYSLIYLAPDIDENFQDWNSGYQYILGIGDNKTRFSIASRLAERNQLTPTIIHPDASVAKNAEIGAGIFIARNAAVNPLASIGDYTILNTSSVVEHECKIGCAAHIGPGTVLAGNVHVGDRTFIGANSVVKQGVAIGDDVIIGAGSVIIKDIPDGITIVGNPGKQIR
jgi:sugar O-acyltransferase (sialic acid O-acetyltransferase NeuD family)